MNTFWPNNLYVWSGWSTARVLTAARADPACGAVRFIVPVHSPDTIFGRYAFLSSSLPASSIASMAPCVRSGQRSKAIFAACPICLLYTSDAADDLLCVDL